MSQAWTKLLPAFIRVRLQGRPKLQKILSNTGWLMTDKISRMGVGLFVGIWLARYLGPEHFGIYNYCIAFVALFSALATLGLDDIVIRNIVKDTDSTNETLGTAFVLKLIGGLLALVLTVSAITLMRPDDDLARWLVAIIATGMIFQSLDVINLWFRSQVQSKYTVYAKNTAFMLIVLVKITLILCKAPLIAFAWAILAEIVLGTVGLAMVYRINRYHFKAWHCSLECTKSLLKDSWPLIFSGIAIFIQARIDQIMLGEMLGNAEVGQYSVAMRLIETFGFIPIIIMSSVAPSITRAKIQGEEIYYERLLSVYRLMFISFLIVAIPIFLFSSHIVVMLYGNEYKAAGVLLSLFSIRLFFTHFGVAKSLFITNNNLFKYSLITSVIGALVNVTLNYFLIPIYGSSGAIWATIVSFTVTIFVIDLFYVKTRRNLTKMLYAMLSPWKLKLTSTPNISI